MVVAARGCAQQPTRPSSCGYGRGQDVIERRRLEDELRDIRLQNGDSTGRGGDRLGRGTS